MKSGVNIVFTDLENALVAEVFGEKLPLIGDGFQTAWENNVAAFRHLGTMRAAIANALNTLLANGFYAMALDEQGDPLTGISLTAAVSAGVEIIVQGNPIRLLVEGFGVENKFDMPSKIVGHANLRGDTIYLEADVYVRAELSGGFGPDILRG